MPELFDYIEAWKRLVDKAFGDGYDTLSVEEKVWFNAQSLVQAIGDGGLISYYYNSGADTLADCLSSLEALGATELKGLLDQVNSLFPGGVPTNINQRNAIISSWPDDGRMDEFLDGIEERAAAEVENLEQQLVAYIQQHQLGT
jgi:hypothetical protein